MSNGISETQASTATSAPRRNRLGTWTVITVLLLLLAGAAGIGYVGWTSGDAEVSASGYIAMALGVVFSLLIGIGLMALVFYSSRKGYDEPAVLIDDATAEAAGDDHQTEQRRDSA